MPRKERPDSTINSNITWRQNKPAFIYNVDLNPVPSAPPMHKIIPLRSCIWLYNLRFSSRTLWYPEAALDRVFKCFPIATWRQIRYQTIGLTLEGINVHECNKDQLFTKFSELLRVVPSQLFHARLDRRNTTSQLLEET